MYRVRNSLGYTRRKQNRAHAIPFSGSRSFLCEPKGALFDDDCALHLRMEGAVIGEASGLREGMSPAGVRSD